jgi:membrane protease YdiL (CAAX protease family)
VTLAVLLWRALTRDRRDYARFKRLRSTKLRRQVFARWIRESWLVIGGLAVALLYAAWSFVDPALRDLRAWGPLAGIPYGSDSVTGIVVGVVAAMVIGMVLPILLLRTKLDEIPAIGDIRALLPRERGELPYGAGLAVTAGVVEEAMFRLALPAAMYGVLGDGMLAFAAAAVVFGLLHVYQGPQGMLFAFLLGAVFTALYVLSGSIVVPIVVHALVDLRSLLLIPVVLGGAWQARPAPGTPPRAAH